MCYLDGGFRLDLLLDHDHKDVSSATAYPFFKAVFSINQPNFFSLFVCVVFLLGMSLRNHEKVLNRGT